MTTGPWPLDGLGSLPADEQVIDAADRSFSFGLGAVWRRRGLLWVLVRRQVSVRYRQMLLGVFWALLEPLGVLLMMTFMFGLLLKVDTGGYPYPVFAFAGLLPWFLFSKGMTAVATSLVENMALLAKVSFPRLILPVAAILRELFDQAVVLAILIAVAAAYGFPPGLRLLAAPLLFAAVAAAAFAFGLWLACVMVPFRDVRPLLALLLQAGMYATPILYPPALVPESILPVYQLNPMYWCVELSRWMMLGQPVAVTWSLWASAGATAAALAGGLAVFALGEKTVVDVL